MQSCAAITCSIKQVCNASRLLGFMGDGVRGWEKGGAGKRRSRKKAEQEKDGAEKGGARSVSLAWHVQSSSKQLAWHFQVSAPLH
jgi:hypothetical protein